MSCDAKSQRRFRRFQQKLRRRLNGQTTRRGVAVDASCKHVAAKRGGDA